jgi:hypothetical protein
MSSCEQTMRRSLQALGLDKGLKLHQHKESRVPRGQRDGSLQP